jgi:hypothetical protein
VERGKGYGSDGRDRYWMRVEFDYFLWFFCDVKGLDLILFEDMGLYTFYE